MSYPQRDQMDGLPQTTNYYLALIAYRLKELDEKLEKLLKEMTEVQP